MSFYKPSRRPGFIAYFRPHPADEARAFRRRQEQQEKALAASRKRIAEDIERAKEKATK